MHSDWPQSPLAPPLHWNVRWRYCLDHPPPPRPSLAPKHKWEDRPAAFTKLSPKHDMPMMPFQQLTTSTPLTSNSEMEGHSEDCRGGLQGGWAMWSGWGTQECKFHAFFFSFYSSTNTKYTPNEREDLHCPPTPAPAPTMPVLPQNKWEGIPSLAQPLPLQSPIPSKQAPGQHC